MNFPKLLQLASKEYKDTIYTPEVERVIAADRDGDFDKFSGLPSVEKDFQYPMCCGRPMQFFFQLTEPWHPTIILQVFQCIEAKCPHTPGRLIRYIDYKTHSIANFPEGPIRAKIVEHAYSYADEPKIYMDNWQHGRYGNIPYQCHRVTKWSPHEELKPTVVEKALLSGLLNAAQRRIPVCNTEGKDEEPIDVVIEKFLTQTRIHGLKFGGSGEPLDGNDTSDYVLHFDCTPYLPYAPHHGQVHISTNLKYLVG